MTTIEKLEKLIYEGFKDTDRKFQETDRKFQETDRKIKENHRILTEQLKETDRILNEKLTALTDKFGDTKTEVENLKRRWGYFVENLVAPGIQRLFSKRNIEINHTYQRAIAKRNGDHMEIDILAIDQDTAVLVEAKSCLSVDDVNDHLERLRKFKTFFPEFKEYKAVGAVAGIEIEENADRYAYKKGLYVIAQSGETVKILNDDNFEPEYW